MLLGPSYTHLLCYPSMQLGQTRCGFDNCTTSPECAVCYHTPSKITTYENTSYAGNTGQEPPFLFRFDPVILDKNGRKVRLRNDYCIGGMFLF